jgi:hypothetical protein
MCLASQGSCTLYIPVERHNAIQPTIIRNLFLQHDNQSLGFFSILEVFRCLRPLPGRSISTPLGPHPCFDPAAFVALASPCSSRLEVSTCRQWGLVVLRSQRVEHLEVTIVRLATTTASTTATTGCAHDCAAAHLLEAASQRGQSDRPEISSVLLRLDCHGKTREQIIGVFPTGSSRMKVNATSDGLFFKIA